MISRRAMMNDKIVSQSGDTLLLEECKGSYLNGLRVFGKSTQFTTTGAQLLHDDWEKSQTSKGVTISLKNCMVSFKGTMDDDGTGNHPVLDYCLGLAEFMGKTLSLVSDDPNLYLCFRAEYSDGSNEFGLNEISVGDNIVNMAARFFYRKTNPPSGTVINETHKVMLCESKNKELPWEPYTGGKPSPNPEYPQPINSVGGSNNLFQIVKENITTRDGFKSVINSDGSLTVTGTPSRQFAIAYSSRINLPTGTYYISDGHNKADEIIFQMAIEYTDNKKRYYNNMAFNIDSTVKTLNLTIQYQSSDLQPVNCTFYPMINKGEKPLPFETYVDSINVDVNGGNLLKPTQKFPITQNGMTLSQNIDGSYHLSGTAILNGNIRIVDPDIETYGLNIPKCTLSLKIKNGEYDGELVVSKPNKEWKILLSVRKNHMSTGSLISDEIGCFVTFTSGVTYNVDLYPMLNAGSTPLPFEPYKPKQTLTIDTPNGLPGIPVNKGGNYMDVNSQQWICDEIDLERGKYVQRIGRKNFKDMTWKKHPVSGTIEGRFYSENVLDIKMSNAPDIQFDALSNKFPSPIDGNVLFNTSVSAISIYREEGEKIFAKIVGVTELEEFVSKTNDAYIIYQLATPIERDLTPEEIAAYKTVHTYAGTTVIMNDENVGMEVSYRKVRG